MNGILVTWLAVVGAFGCGCSGINVQKSFSPLDFILPGLMQNGPSTPTLPGSTNAAGLLATTSNPPPRDACPSGSDLQCHRSRVRADFLKEVETAELPRANVCPVNLRRPAGAES